MSSSSSPQTGAARPRLGFLGVGWIGRNRLEAIAASGAATVEAVADRTPELARAGAAAVGCPTAAATLDELLELDLDGIVIATPSALHAEQAERALEAGVAVFCQKPLGRDARESGRVVEAARRADRLLGVDFSYRETDAMRAVKALLERGGLGHVHAVQLTFHNAYGPDKPWFYDPKLSGGGCVIDLGIHLVDLALWGLDFPPLADVRSALFAGGRRLESPHDAVEDCAHAQLDFGGGTSMQLACSWKLHAGQSCVITAAFHGTEGGATFRNVGGSFYDFVAEHHRGTESVALAAPPDAWGGRAAVSWARRLSTGCAFDPEASRIVDVARVLDRIYGR